MAEKVTIELGNIQITLLLSLWGRTVETKKKEQLFDGLMTKINVHLKRGDTTLKSFDTT